MKENVVTIEKSTYKHLRIHCMHILITENWKSFKYRFISFVFSNPIYVSQKLKTSTEYFLLNKSFKGRKEVVVFTIQQFLF